MNEQTLIVRLVFDNVLVRTLSEKAETVRKSRNSIDTWIHGETVRKCLLCGTDVINIVSMATVIHVCLVDVFLYYANSVFLAVTLL